MEEALKTRRWVYAAGALLAAVMWGLIYLVGSRVDGPVVRVGIDSEIVLAGAAAFCLMAALFVVSMKPKLVDQIIDQARRKSADDATGPTLKMIARQLSLMGAGLGWSILTAGYVAVSLTGLYSTYAAFVLMAAVVSGAAAARIGGLLGHAERMGIEAE